MIYSAYWTATRAPATNGSGMTPATVAHYPKDKAYDWYRIMATISPDAHIPKAPAYRELLEGNKDSFIFIVTAEQHPEFTKWLKDNDFGKYIVFKTDKPLRNENYPGSAPRLYMYVLAGTEHMMRGFNAED